MKDIINKLSDIENTPDRPSKANKKILKEEKTPQPKEITKNSSFKDVFENMSMMSNMKPLPVVNQAGTNNQETGSAAFLDIDDNSPSAKAIQSAVSDLAQQNKAQIVVPNTQAGAPNNISAQSMQAVNQNQQNQMQQPLREVDGAPKVASVYVSVTDDDCEAEYQFDDDGDVELTGVYDSNDRNVIDLLSFNELEAVRQQVVDSLENEKAEHGDYEYEKSQDKKLDELSPQTLQRYSDKSNQRRTDLDKDYDITGPRMGHTPTTTPSASAQRVGARDIDAGDYSMSRKTAPVAAPVNAEKRKRFQGSQMAANKLSGNARVPANEGIKDVVKKGAKNLKRGMKGWEKGMHDVDTVKQANKTLDDKGKEDILKSNPTKGSPADLQKKLVARDKRKTTNEGIKEKIKGALRREFQKDMPFVQTRRDYAWMKAGDAFQQGNKRKGNQYMAWQERDRKRAGDPTTNPEGTYRTKTTDFNESKKPDFLDLDKDGNKKETMKKAAADKKKQKVKESMNHKINAARLEGKTHGLRGHAYHGKTYEDMAEMKAYHEGYKEGLDECYMNEDSATSMSNMSNMPSMTMEGEYGNVAAELEQLGEQIADLAEQAMDLVRGTPEESRARSYWYPHILGAVTRENQFGGSSMITLMDTVEALNSDGEEDFLGELDGAFGEGNAFTGNLAKARAMGAKEFDLDGDGDLEPVTEFDEMFESWDKQLNELINENKKQTKKPLTEGLSVSMNKGNGMGSDSVSITATDQDADELLALIKNSGLGLFGDEAPSEPSSAMSVQPQEVEPESEIEVVDGADSMLGLMQKLSGMETAAGDDYEEEYSDAEFGEEEPEAMIGADWGFGTGNYTAAEPSGEFGDEESEDEDEDEEEYEYDSEESEDEESEEEESEDDSEEDEDEDEDKEEKVDEGSDTCMECGGMMEAGHSCGSKEMVEESDFFGLINKLNKLAEGDEFDSEGKPLASQESFESFKEKVANSDDPFEIVHDGLKGVYGDEVLEKLQQCEDEVIQDSEGTLHPDDDHEEVVERIIEKMNEPEEDDMSPYGEEDSTDWPLEDGEELREWANKAGKRGTEHAFTQDTEFMTQTIAGGLNKPKSTGQTTIPVIASQTDRQDDGIADIARLAGIKK